MKLLIHFGVHRTGTTFIQSNLAQNQRALKENGFLYPNIQHNASHVRLPTLLKSNTLTPTDVIAEIEDQITPAIHTVILSSENFCYPQCHEALKQISEGFELYAMVYLRRQDLWLESWYNQHVKWPWSGQFSGSSFADFLRRIDDFQWIDYRKLLNSVEQLVPRDRIHVKDLDEHGLQNSFEDFLQYCGIRSSWLNICEKSRNCSLSSAKIDILRRIDIFGLQPAARQRIIRALGKIEIEEDNGKGTLLTDRQRKIIIKKFSKSNQHVAQQHFGRKRLFSDYVANSRHPAFVGDSIAYRKYIPELLKRVAEEQMI